MTRDEALAGFPVAIAVPVWWGDQDAFGHVNNVVHFRWYESARIAYLDRIGLTGPAPDDPIGPILAAITGNYRRQLVYPDTVHVGARVSRIGRSSLTMDHVIYSDSLADVAGDGVSTIVAFDYKVNRSTPVPEAIRRAIETIERRIFDPST